MFVFALLPVARQICVFWGHRAGLNCASLLTFSARGGGVAWRLRLLLPEHSRPTGGGQKGGSAGKMKGFDVPFAVFPFLSVGTNSSSSDRGSAGATLAAGCRCFTFKSVLVFKHL